MTYIPHKWIAGDDTQCEVCGILAEEFHYIIARTAMPTCTFGDVWYLNQPSVVDSDTIDTALATYEGIEL